MSDISYAHSRSKLDPVVLLNVLFVLGVLLLHHRSYTKEYLSLYSLLRLNLYLQRLAVGGFLFLSGYKLTCSKRDDRALPFIRNRFARIYVLYLIALVAFSFTSYPYQNDGRLPSLLNFVVHSACLQSVLPNLFQRNYPTLWFVSILICCYLFFLTARAVVQRWHVFLIVTAVLFLFVWAAHQLSGAYGVELFCGYWCVYLGYFAAGMLFAAYRDAASRLPNRLLWALLALGLIGFLCLLNCIYVNSWYERLADFGLVLLSTVPLYLLVFNNCQRFSLSSWTTTALGAVSYSAYCAFLFHRPIWTVMNRLWPEQSFPQWLFIVPFGISTILALSFGCQRIYDHAVQALRGLTATGCTISDRLPRVRVD